MLRLFDHKHRDFVKPAQRAETTYSFLDRSSKPEFKRIRDMLERWIARLPEKQRRDAVAKMRHKHPGSQKKENQFNAAFFELFLHELLLGTGEEVAAEPIINGKTPDFVVTERLARGGQLNYIVEATDIDLERGTKLERDWNELKALDTLDEIYSPDFRLLVRVDGKLESSPRKPHLKGPFEKLLSGAKYEELLPIAQEQQSLKLEHFPSASFSHGDWKVTGQLWPVSPEHRGKTTGFVGIVSRGADIIDDIDRTKGSLYAKAKRYKNVENLIIALRCDNSNDRLDEVLFGSQQVTFYFHNDPADTTPLPEPHNRQKLNGFWINSNGPINRHVIGVVAFYGVYPSALDKARAVFYSNPYLDQPMPVWTELLAHAEYSGGGISIVDGVAPHKFLRDYEVIGDPFV